MNNWYYFLIIGSAVLVPFIFSFHKGLAFRPRRGNAFVAMVAVALFFIAWDIFFTARGVWGFNPRYHLSILMWGLPLEEILFFLFIPFCCLFTYHCLGNWKVLSNNRGGRFMAIAGAGIFLLLALTNMQRAYTFTASGITALVFIYAAYKNPPYLKQFFVTYAVLTVPFLIVNGALTGSFSPEPVVWYNTAHITGVRVSTIPAEDFVYSALMIFLNVGVFEWRERRAERSRGAIQGA